VYARVARFEGADPARMDEATAMAREMVESSWDSPPQGLDDATGVLMLVDRESGRSLGITLFASEEGMRRGHEALDAMTPPGGDGSRRASVEFYEVALHRDR
jgi:hypothetical protein